MELFRNWVCAAIFCGTTLALHAAEPWQRLQMPTAAQVARAWQSPPPEYGPEPYYGMNGPVSLPQVDRDLDTLKKLGFQAVTVQAGYGMPFAYLSPAYFSFFHKLVEAARTRNMRVWIVDDAGYPSGFAGGRFTASAPDLRMQALEVVQTLPVPDSGTLDVPLPADAVSAAAVDPDGHALPVPVQGGRLRWSAPHTAAGSKWTVLIAAHTFRTSPTRSDTNPRRVKDGEQSLEDYMNPAATAQFLAWTHEQYKRAMGGEFGRTILGFRGDEPDYSIPGLPWTPAFFKTFQAEKGYDVRPYTALFAQTPSPRRQGVAIQLTPEQVRIKADYYDVFSRMFAKGFFDPQGAWCAANHLEYQVHLNHEEREMELTHSEGSFFRDMRQVEVPGIDAIWHQIWTDTVSNYPRLASSEAHVYGKPRAFTESFAAYRPEPDTTMARYILNEQFVRGVNLVEMMYFPATTGGTRPLPLYMQGPDFPTLALYVRRMSYLMAMGRPAASVALFLPSSSMWLGDTNADTQFVSDERLLSEHQIDFDIVSEDALARDMKDADGAFTTRSGNRYRTVLLPAPAVLTQTTLDRLAAFAHAGGKVVFLGGAPQWIAGRSMREGRAPAPADFRWATVVHAELPPTPTPPQFPPASPPAPQVVPPAVLQALTAAVTAPTLRLDTPDAALRVMHRRWKDADVYLLFNEGGAESEHTVTLMSRAQHAARWDPQTGVVAPVAATRAAGGLSVRVHLKPYETCVLVLR